jgi:hypothetical protein
MHINSAISIAQTSQTKAAATTAITEATQSQTNTTPVQQETVILSDEAKAKIEAEIQGGGWGSEPPKVEVQGGGWGTEPQQE